MTVLTTGARPRAASRTLQGILAWPHWFWVALALYLVAHVLLRLWETPNIGKNEVQEAVAAQAWAWGYHPRNPPLHTWLMMASYSVFGVGLLAHVVLKYILLGAMYAFAFLSARRLLTSAVFAAFAALSVSLLAPMAWTVHTASTHTLLMAAMIFATLWSALRLTATRRFGDYALFGVAIALGILSKYSYPLFLISLIAAMLSQRELRSALVTPRMLLSLGVAAALLAPHAVWMATARFDFVEFLAEKQGSVVASPYVVDVATGISAIALGALTFLGPFILVAPFVFRRVLTKGPVMPASAWSRAALLIPVFGVGLLILDVLVLRAVQFEERYMTCALLTSPLAVFAWLERRAPDEGWMRPLAICLAVIATLSCFGLAARAMFYHEQCNRCWEEMPVASLESQIRADGFVHGSIIADHYNVAGNMRLAFPEARITAANYYVAQPPTSREGQCMLVWNARNAGDAVPDAIAQRLEQINLALPPGSPRYVEAPLYRSERMDRFGYWILPNADGNCTPRGAIG